ncbi:Subunit of the glycosylphosphatidylinositol transamidase complex-like protein [Tulasnella sp. 330]|nr:Subunit of the glycosylphosphatidylinositol transamidase complex-like protein [Tulasnella sp. 330]KAG8886234.1 Subunit of the glycosylphosphatidylinositol transamidase complex-like protein [Tulasnella sp. 331]KAG8887288.1 Subunit of the glycosylphosphatidylinositol transamidase complex-like protein [Tulasnella sp. 332]
MLFPVVLCLLYLVDRTLSFSTNENFSELLHLRSLPDGKVYARFAFTTVLSDASPRRPETLGEEDESQHYTLFPLPLGQLLRAHAITELHLNLNAGKWDYDDWGQPTDESVGAGAELWVWMAEGGHISTDQRWKDLANGLSGLFCASLGGLDHKRTTRPQFAFQPEGDLSSNSTHQLLHAFLPSESVCTENLTPFLKLLPCKSRSGVASLLNPHQLFDANYHGIGIHVVWKEGTGVELNLTFNAVLDPVRTSGRNGKRDWSVSTLFGRTIPHACPIASSSHVEVDLPIGAPYHITPEPLPVNDTGLAIYNLSEQFQSLDISLHWPFEPRFQPVSITPSSSISAKRVLTGGSQSRGGILYTFTNRFNEVQKVVCVESAPWFINYFLNTRKVTVDGVTNDDVIQHTAYTLPRSHHPTLMETTLRLPPNSTTSVHIAFSKGFIAYTEHPPDAERGWDLPPAVISYKLSDEEPDRRIYTRNLLIDLPTPDFSMPYNVIIMSSTVVTLFFGSIFNVLTRKFIWVKTG